MAGFDASKDILVKEKELFDGTHRIAVFSYNNGPEKVVIQVKDSIKVNGEDKIVWKNHKGRMPVSEMKVIAESLVEIL